jgi:hypothetical protein
MNELLGKKVKFKKHMVREEKYNGTKEWKEYDNKESQGIICGVRIVKNGYSDGYFDEARYFKITSTQKVYIVACNLRGFYKVKPESIIESEDKE